ncbi:hypothetical protein QN277_014724 [Acacia crassicarpa]|uniref:Uncharacterized protein n=1 Tax=Acacia crassicarpa TaxID=499986 RepID=A0AAE1MSL9_9FABA|nr:hypothetical protein QN277_014724 [Acacia crassicarpa]
MQHLFLTLRSLDWQIYPFRTDIRSCPDFVVWLMGDWILISGGTAALGIQE